jgi:hypothetical protein
MDLVRNTLRWKQPKNGDNLLRVLDIINSRQQSWVRSGRQVRLSRELKGITESSTFVHRKLYALQVHHFHASQGAPRRMRDCREIHWLDRKTG